jgi:hypothetical protein
LYGSTEGNVNIGKLFCSENYSSFWLWWWCRGQTTSLNCGHQWPVVHPPGDIWAWRTMVKECSLAILPAEKSSSKSRGSGRRE